MRLIKLERMRNAGQVIINPEYIVYVDSNPVDGKVESYSVTMITSWTFHIPASEYNNKLKNYEREK